MTTAGSWISRTNSGRLPFAVSARNVKDEDKAMHGGDGVGGTVGSDEVFNIGACDVGISGKSIRSLHPPLRGDIGHTDSSKGQVSPGGWGGVGATLAGPRAGSEFDVSKFGSPNQPPKGDISKEVNLSFI